MSDDEFSELEEMLVSDDVPADCMNLEMLDGYLAAVIAGPVVQAPADWLAACGRPTPTRRVSALQVPHARRSPWCFATTTRSPRPSPGRGRLGSPSAIRRRKDAPPLGDEWIAGFEQASRPGLPDWRERLTEDDAEIADGLIERAFAPWASDEEEGDLEVRLGWLAESAQAVRGSMPTGGSSVCPHRYP